MSEISYYEPHHDSGIDLSATLEIDWYNLGDYFARQASDSQAQFLLGMCAEFTRMGVLDRALQFHWLSQQVEGTSVGIDTVRGVISELLDGLGGEGA